MTGGIGFIFSLESDYKLSSVSALNMLVVCGLLAVTGAGCVHGMGCDDSIRYALEWHTGGDSTYPMVSGGCISKVDFFFDGEYVSDQIKSDHKSRMPRHSSLPFSAPF